MTDTEKALRDAIIELAHSMVTHVDPHVIEALIDRLIELDTEKE